MPEYSNDSLFLAVNERNLADVRANLIYGIEANIIDENGWTPLYHATRLGHLPIMTLLLECGAHPDEGCSYTGVTPLHEAALSRNVSAVELLLKFNASVDARTSSPSGYTPLHWGVRFSHFDAEKQLQIAKLLCAAGANVNAMSDSAGWGLIRMPASLLGISKDVFGWEFFVFRNGIQRFFQGRNALILVDERLFYADVHLQAGWAVGENRYSESVKAWCDKYKSIITTDYRLASPEEVKIIEDITESPHSSTDSPLMLSIFNPCICDFLLQQKVDIHAKDSDGRTAFHRAAEHNETEIMHMLLLAGAEEDWSLIKPEEITTREMPQDLPGDNVNMTPEPCLPSTSSELVRSQSEDRSNHRFFSASPQRRMDADLSTSHFLSGSFRIASYINTQMFFCILVLIMALVTREQKDRNSYPLN